MGTRQDFKHSKNEIQNVNFRCPSLGCYSDTRLKPVHFEVRPHCNQHAVQMSALINRSEAPAHVHCDKPGTRYFTPVSTQNSGHYWLIIIPTKHFTASPMSKMVASLLPITTYNLTLENENTYMTYEPL